MLEELGGRNKTHGPARLRDITEYCSTGFLKADTEAYERIALPLLQLVSLPVFKNSPLKHYRSGMLAILAEDGFVRSLIAETRALLVRGHLRHVSPSELRWVCPTDECSVH